MHMYSSCDNINYLLFESSQLIIIALNVYTCVYIFVQFLQKISYVLFYYQKYYNVWYKKKKKIIKVKHCVLINLTLVERSFFLMQLVQAND